jgi:hypothetical protein
MVRIRAFPKDIHARGSTARPTRVLRFAAMLQNSTYLDPNGVQLLQATQGKKGMASPLLDAFCQLASLAFNGVLK